MKASDLFQQSSGGALIGGEIADDAPVGTITDKIGYDAPKWFPLDGTATISPTTHREVYGLFASMPGITYSPAQVSLNGFEENTPVGAPTFDFEDVTGLAYSPDGTLLAVQTTSAADDIDMLRVYDTSTWTQVYSGLDRAAFPSGLDVSTNVRGRMLKFSPDGAFLVAQYNTGDIFALDTATWAVEYQSFGNTGDFAYFCISPDSSLFVFGGMDVNNTKYVIVRTDTWVMITRSMPNTNNAQHNSVFDGTGDAMNNPAWCFEFTPDMQFFVGCYKHDLPEKSFFVWQVVDKYDYATWIPVANPLSSTNPNFQNFQFTDIEFQGGGSTLFLMTNRSGTTQIPVMMVDYSNWQIVRDNFLVGFNNPIRVGSARFHPDGETVLMSPLDDQPAVMVFNFYTGVEVSGADVYSPVGDVRAVDVNLVTGDLAIGTRLINSIGPRLQTAAMKSSNIGIILPDVGTANTLCPLVPFKIKVLP